MAKLAINGGDKAVNRSLGRGWPIQGELEDKALQEVRDSNRWWGGGEGSKVWEFEDTFAQYQVVPVSAVPLTGDTRYYFDLEPVDLRGSPEGLDTYRISGQLRNTGSEDVESIRLVAVTYDGDNRVLAQRQADLAVNLLRAGAATPFELDLIIPVGTVDHFSVLAQGLSAE